jgi:hypothetical protein
MALGMLILVALVIVFTIGKAQGDKIATLYPILTKPIAAIGNMAVWTVWAAIIGGIIWMNMRPPAPLPPPKPLPETIQPPALEGTVWTVYDRSSKRKAQLALDLASRQTKKDGTFVWTRYDDFSKQETVLTLTRYDCEFGKSADIYDVYYEKGVYAGFGEDDKKEETKVDLENIVGSGFLLACFNKMPSVIDND